MDTPQPSPDQIVSCILLSWEEGISEEVLLKRLQELGLPPSACEEALELVKQGMMRSSLIQVGLPPNQISSDTDDHPVFLAALNAANQRAKSLPSALAQQPNDQSTGDSDEDVEVRRTSAYELGNSSDPKAVEKLLDLSQDQDLHVRIYAIQSLSRLKAASAVSPCCSLLSQSSEPLILSNVIRALVTIGDPLAIPSLIDATRHANPFVRHDAAWALGEFSDPSIIPALEALLQDTTLPEEKDELGITLTSSMYRVCDQAERSLQKLTSRQNSNRAGCRQVFAPLLLCIAVINLVIKVFV